MISQCIYCERTFRTNDEERNWCDDCEDEAISTGKYNDDDRGGTGHGDESLSDTDPGL